MGLSRDGRRRWLGGICLVIAAGMVALGLTLLKERLTPKAFILYWSACMLTTGLAVIIALLDLRAVRLRSQREEVELMNQTLREIEQKKDERGAEKRRNGQK